MSIKVMQIVWERLPLGGTPLMVALKCADFGNDEGASIYPSIPTLACYARVSADQARRAVRELERGDWLSVVGNHAGGASTRQYRLNVPKLLAAPSIQAVRTPRTSATPSADATPCTDARDPLHGCTPTPRTGATQINNRTIRNREKKGSRDEAAQRVLSFLNEKANRNFPPKDTNLRLIAARIGEGYTEIQLRQVVAMKVRSWKGHETMDQYLRPKTLFGASNFSNYVGELVVQEEPP